MDWRAREGGPEAVGLLMAHQIVPVFPRSVDDGYNEFLSRWAAQRMPDYDGSVPFWPCYSIAFVRANDPRQRPLAVAAYHGHNAKSGDMHLSGASESPMWATRDAIRWMLWYPFVKHRCRRLTTITARDNKRARRFDEKIGFKVEGVHPKAWDGRRDSITYGMLREKAFEMWKLEEFADGQGVGVRAVGA